MKTENCVYNENVVKQMLREITCHVPALCYDTLPREGSSEPPFKGNWNQKEPLKYKNGEHLLYRKDDNMRFVSKPSTNTRNDNPWQEFNLLLINGEYADYTVRGKAGSTVYVYALIKGVATRSRVGVFVDDYYADETELDETKGLTKIELCKFVFEVDGEKTIRLMSKAGAIEIDTIYFK